MGQQNIPESPTVVLTEDVQFSSNVVNLHIPGYGASRLGEDQDDYAAEVVGRQRPPEVLRQDGHVLGSLTERGNPDADHIQPVQESLAKACRGGCRETAPARRSTNCSSGTRSSPPHPHSGDTGPWA